MNTGLTPQFIMRASLKRHLAEVSIAQATTIAKGETVYRHESVDMQRLGGESEIENLNWYTDYSEPGYSNNHGDKGILTANWNYFHRGVTDLLEQAGFECEWSDEWAACDDCGKLVRTSGDCYGWQPYYVIEHDCETVCLNCIDWADYLESIEDNPSKACMAECNPSEYGYVLIQDHFENGLHPGMDDDPKKILKALQEQGYEHLVFRVSETSQFYSTFEVWEKAMTIDRVLDTLSDPDAIKLLQAIAA